MDRAQFLWRTHVGLTLVADNLVGHAKLFQQPQHALRARIVQVMDGEHGDPRCLALVAPYSVVPVAHGKVEMARSASITRILLTPKIYPGNIGGNVRGISGEFGVWHLLHRLPRQ